MDFNVPVPFLATPGQPSMPWLQWRRLFNNYLLASGHDGDGAGRKTAILLHSIGAEGQRIYYTLPEIPVPEGEDPADAYDTALQKLQNHFTPQINIVCERYKFRQRKHLQGEPVESYVAALRELAVTCNFGNLADEMIRDQLVEKTYSARIRERLLMEPNLTLQMAIQIVQRVETAVKESKNIGNNGNGGNGGNGSTGGAVSAVAYNKPNNMKKHDKKLSNKTDKKFICYRCGSHSHIANSKDCKARNERCRLCDKPGHFAKVCRSAKQVKQVIATDIQENDSFQVLGIHAVAPIKQNITCDISVNNVPFQVIVDSASDASLMNIKQFKKHFVTESLEKCVNPFTSYTNNIIDVVGSFQTNVSYNGKSTVAKWFIVKQGTTLIGKDLIQALSLTIDGKTLTCNATSMKENTPAPNNLQNITVRDPVAAEFPELFNDEPGLIKGYKHQIRLKEGAQPKQQKLRSVPFAVRDQLKEALQSQVDIDHIEPVEASEWVHPLVIAWKKDGTIRPCVDLRELNKQIVIERYVMPNTEELFSELHGATVFSKLDLKSAYHQVELTEDCRHLTTFITPTGLFRYKRVCFGLASAPACFQRLMDNVLKGLDGVKCYQDDIIIYGKSATEHDQNLRSTMQRLNDVGMKLKMTKCVFRVPSIPVLGHVVNSEGLQPNPDLVKAIVDAPQPTSNDQIRSFLGLVGYYAKFVPHFTDTVQPMRDVQAASSFKWSHEADTAFKEVKHAITQSPVLGLFDPSHPTIVTTDASGYGVGAVMTQMIDQREVTIAYASRKLTDNEKKYSAGEREALACLWAIERWHTYLWGHRFILRTDHQALTTLLGTSGTGHRPMRIARWGARLLEYDYEIQYKPAVYTTVADALSRLPIEGADNSTNNASDQEIVRVCAINSSSISKSKLQAATQADDTMTNLQEYIHNGWPSKPNMLPESVKPYFVVRHELSIHDGINFRGTRVVVPSALTSELVTTAHENHQGIVRTKQRLRQLYWWPKMDCAVQNAIKSCYVCQAHDKSASVHSGPMQSVPYPSGPWKKLGMDIVGPYPTKQNRFAITLIDYYSKWPEVMFVNDVTASSVIEFLKSIFSREGYPDEIVTDHGVQFMSNELAYFLQQRGIKHTTSAIYHPQGNSEVERFNKVLGETVLSAKLEQTPIPLYVREFLAVYRSTPHATTNEEPSVLLHGRHLKTKLDITGVTTSPKFAGEERLRTRVTSKQAKSCLYTDKYQHANDRKFFPGDKVKILKPGHVPKGSSKYSDPLTVIARIRPYTYLLSNGQTWNISRLAKCNINEAINTEPHIDIDFPVQQPIGPHQQPLPNRIVANNHRPGRVRRQPAYLQDYVR